jgi:hypothetical protein
MKTSDSQFPISHVATHGMSLNPGRITTRPGNRGGAFSGQETGHAALPTGKENKPHPILGGHSINTSARPKKGDKRTAFNAASSDLVKSVKESKFTKQSQKDDELTNNYRKAQGLIGSGDRPVVKIRSNK